MALRLVGAALSDTAVIGVEPIGADTMLTAVLGVREGQKIEKDGSPGGAEPKAGALYRTYSHRRLRRGCFLGTDKQIWKGTRGVDLTRGCFFSSNGPVAGRRSTVNELAQCHIFGDLRAAHSSDQADARLLAVDTIGPNIIILEETAVEPVPYRAREESDWRRWDEQS
jgi:hypothetical protein